MLGKSIIAGTVLTLMAGGVVYFGTDVSAENTTKTKTVTKPTVSETIEETSSAVKETLKTAKTTAGKTIRAKKLTIKTAETPEVIDNDGPNKTDKNKEVKTQKKWLDQYLKSEKPKTKANPRKIKTKEVTSWEPSAKEQMKRMKIQPKASYGSGNGASRKETGTYMVEGENVEIDILSKEDIEEAEEKGFKKRLSETENIWIEKSDSKKTERKMLHDIIKKDRAEKEVEVDIIANEEGETKIETETIDMGDGKVMKIVKKMVKSETGHDKDHKKMRIKIITDEEGHNGVDIKGDTHSREMGLDSIGKVKVKKDISKTVKLIMAETKKIEMSELRDRAYLDLVTYALNNCSYGTANEALSKIQQVELRDTARNRIAVAYAKDGDAEKAFKILEDIEVDAVRDVMRLQVIEAMIAPDELPKDMQ